MSQKRRHQIISNLDCLPGHKSRFEDLFTKIESVSLRNLKLLQMYPKQNIQKMIDHAGKATSGDLSVVSIATTQQQVSRSKDRGSNERLTRNQSTSLGRKFTGLDPMAKSAINESFLLSVRACKVQVPNVADAFKDFLNRGEVPEHKQQRHISSIFGSNNPKSRVQA